MKDTPKEDWHALIDKIVKDTAQESGATSWSSQETLHSMLGGLIGNYVTLVEQSSKDAQRRAERKAQLIALIQEVCVELIADFEQYHIEQHKKSAHHSVAHMNRHLHNQHNARAPVPGLRRKRRTRWTHNTYPGIGPHR